MPVPEMVTPGAARLSGLVPPDLDESGITEIRVHGVGGATPESQLADLAPQQVAGDRLAGFYRTQDAAGRHVEAYSWGGLTSRSGSRVLWLLLLPFMLGNLAGWMAPRSVMSSPRPAALHRWTTRWVALAVTLNVFLIFAVMTLDILGYQCGGQLACVDGRWWLTPLTWGDGLAHPGRRLVVGAVPLLLGALAMAGLTHLSRSRYEAVDPPYRGDAREPSPAGSAAALKDGLSDPDFWHGYRSTTRLGRCHLAASIAFLSLVVLWTVNRTMDASGSGRLGPLWVVGVVVAIGALLASAALLTREEAPDWTGAAVVAGATVAALIAAAYGWWQPAADSPAVPLPGMRTTINWTYGLVAVSLVPSFALAVWATLRRGRAKDAHTFPWGAPFIVGCLAVMLLNTVLVGVLIRVAAFAGDVAYDLGDWQRALGDGAGHVFVYPMIAKAAPYLTLLPIGVLLGFVVIEGARFWAAGRPAAAAGVADEYLSALREEAAPAPSPDRPAVWYASVFAGTPPAADPQTVRAAEKKRKKFAAQVARARWVATANTHLGWMLVALVALALVALVWIELLVWRPPYAGPWAPDWFIDLGTSIAGLVPLLLLALVRWAWSRPKGRRLIGVLWDVGTFWPRAYHPWAPPSYAERAVPELQRRMWWLHDSGGRVLLAAHSQGTIVAAAALLQRGRRPTDDVVSLATFGSPLRTLYRWAFPAYFSSEVLDTLGTSRRLHSWRNFHYRTDYVGGAVNATHAGESVDQLLADPAGSRHVYGQPPQRLRRHTGYWDDRRMWREIDVMAADLAATMPGGPPGGGGDAVNAAVSDQPAPDDAAAAADQRAPDDAAAAAGQPAPDEASRAAASRDETARAEGVDASQRVS